MCKYCKTETIINKKIGSLFDKDLCVYAAVDQDKLYIGYGYDHVHEIYAKINYCPMCGKRVGGNVIPPTKT